MFAKENDVLTDVWLAPLGTVVILLLFVTKYLIQIHVIYITVNI